MTAGSILILGSSDGIGLATTRMLLEQGRRVLGLSRSDSSLTHERYQHVRIDVLNPGFIPALRALIAQEEDVDTCIFCVGVGNEIEDEFWLGESVTVRTNLLAMIETVECLLPRWLEQGHGHFIGLSSLADCLRIPDAASYCASKAGFSNYLESLGLRLRKTGVAISNVRFGFVDTKMAHSPIKPAMISAEKAARILHQVLEKKPLRLNRPRRIVPLVAALGFVGWLQTVLR